jgi:serine/threonine-protein kinase
MDETKPSRSLHLPVEPGDVIDGKYHLRKLIGEGGAGFVFEAWHDVLEQRVAIKVLPRGARRQPGAVERFLREARAAAKLQSVHAVGVHDVGTLADGVPFIVMEHLTGEDLGAICDREGRLPIGQAVDYVLQACAAVAEAHSLGIVHRDLKPQNLFAAEMRDGTTVVKVLDFGVSKIRMSTVTIDDIDDIDGIDVQELTNVGMLVGTPRYMSPEQLTNPSGVSPQSDIWSLGVVLHRMLTGTAPFDGESLRDVSLAIVGEDPPAVHVLRPEVQPELAQVVARCMRKAPEARFADVAAFAEALLPFASKTRAAAVDRMMQLLRPTASATGDGPLSESLSEIPTRKRAAVRRGADGKPQLEARTADAGDSWSELPTRKRDAVNRKPRRARSSVLLAVLAAVLLLAAWRWFASPPTDTASTATPRAGNATAPPLSATISAAPTMLPTTTPTARSSAAAPSAAPGASARSSLSSRRPARAARRRTSTTSPPPRPTPAAPAPKKSRDVELDSRL